MSFRGRNAMSDQNLDLDIGLYAKPFSLDMQEVEGQTVFTPLGDTKQWVADLFREAYRKGFQWPVRVQLQRMENCTLNCEFTTFAADYIPPLASWTLTLTGKPASITGVVLVPEEYPL